MSAEPGADRRAASLLAAIAEPAVLVGGEGRIAAWNDAAAARLGLGPAAVGRRPEEALRPWWSSVRRISLAGDIDGALLVCSLGPAGIGPDDLALQREDTVGRIAGGITHDLSNPLGAIVGLAGMLADEPGVPDDLRSLAGGLEDSAQRTLAIVKGLLEYARRRPLRVEAVSVGPIVRGVMDLLRHATTNMTTRVSVSDELPEVEADASMLRQALMALALNALEAQGVAWGPGAPEVHGRLLISGSARDDAGGRRVRLAIEDGAPTVSEPERAALFAGGAARSGRDLAVARAIVARFGGRISLEPVAAGNRIVVDLPVVGAVLAAPDPEPAPVPAETPAAAESAVPERPLVLVCDDEPLVRGLMVRYMERAGLRAVEAHGGREAVEILGRQRVAMVIADHRMPDLSGVELYEAAVTIDPALAARFILTSGDAGTGDVIAFAERTGVPVLSKPFDQARLVALVRSALGG